MILDIPHTLHAIDRLIYRITSFVVIAFFLLMLGLAAFQVGLRYFFGSSIAWADIATRNLVLWVGLLGAALATSEGKHFQIDVITRFLPHGYQPWSHRLSNLFSAIICFLLGQASMTFLSLDAGVIAFLEIPATYIESVIPYSFYLMAIQFLLRLAPIAQEETK
jgi:TRAP-type C4-dicarboxylate transport system permease small subunit